MLQQILMTYSRRYDYFIRELFPSHEKFYLYFLSTQPTVYT